MTYYVQVFLDFKIQTRPAEEESTSQTVTKVGRAEQRDDSWLSELMIILIWEESVMTSRVWESYCHLHAEYPACLGSPQWHSRPAAPPTTRFFPMSIIRSCHTHTHTRVCGASSNAAHLPVMDRWEAEMSSSWNIFALPTLQTQSPVIRCPKYCREDWDLSAWRLSCYWKALARQTMNRLTH